LGAVSATFDQLVVDEVAPQRRHIVGKSRETVVELGFCDDLAGLE
jgi:hypothetical protein